MQAQPQALVHRPGPRSEGCPGDACARDYKLYKDYAHLLIFTRGRTSWPCRFEFDLRPVRPFCTSAPTGTPLTLHGRRETRFDSKSCLYVHASPHAGVVPAVIQRKKRERARPRSSLRFLIFSHSAALPHESSLRSTLSFAASVSSLMNHCSILKSTQRQRGRPASSARQRAAGIARAPASARSGRGESAVSRLQSEPWCREAQRAPERGLVRQCGRVREDLETQTK